MIAAVVRSFVVSERHVVSFAETRLPDWGFGQTSLAK